MDRLWRDCWWQGIVDKLSSSVFPEHLEGL